MQLTLTGEYAVRAMIHLAAAPEGGIVQISDISSRWDIPESFLRKIIPLLSKAKLVSSRRGNGGGVCLAKPADSINLVDVIEAVEGPLYLNKCLIGPEYCTRSRWCAVHCLWSEAQENLKQTLRSKSIAALAALSFGAEGREHQAAFMTIGTYPSS